MTLQKSDEKKQGESKLNAELDNVLSAIADDLGIINKGEKGDLKILNLDDKLYSRIMNLLKSPDEVAGKSSKKVAEAEPEVKKPNIQDAVLNRVKK